MSSYSDFANASSDILLKKGDALAGAKARSGELWGSTIANLGQVIPQQVQDVMQAAAAKKKEAQIGQIFQQSGGDLEKAIPEVMKIDRDLGLKLTKEHHEAKKLAFEMQELDWKYKTQKAEMADRMIGQVVDDDSWGRFVLAKKATGEDVSGYPDHFDPVFVRQLKISYLPILKQLELDAPKEPKLYPLTPGMKLFDESGAMKAENPYQLTPDQVADNERATAAEQRAEATAAALQSDRAADNARADKQLAVSQGQLSVAQKRLAQQAATASTAGKPGATPSGLPANYDLLLGRATLNLPDVRRGNINRTAKMAYEQGGEDALKDVIRQAATDTENVDTKNQVLGRAATVASLKDAQAILDEFEKSGVPTGFLTGTAEDLMRKIGNTTNPKYVELRNRLAGTLINYRRAATGVAFGEKESAEYERMFPNYKNTFPVNKALISGLLREMGTYDAAYWSHKLGPEGAKLIGVAGDKVTTLPGADGGVDVSAPNGKTYHFKTKAQAEAFKSRAGIK